MRLTVTIALAFLFVLGLPVASAKDTPASEPAVDLSKIMGTWYVIARMPNPVERGHVAFRTDDIAAFKKRLEDKGIAYSDFGTWAMNGWHQIFFYDPDGNIIEVHQVQE